jgi:DNA adenine methylase
LAVTRESSATRYVTPLRYPGGKAKVANYIKLLMLRNGLVGHDYVEPYAGGASVALTLLFEDYARDVHINDLNPGVHAFWSAVLNDTDELCSRISRTRVSIRQWRTQREIYRSLDPDLIDLAFATFFLNRTNRSGIIGGGVIGGQGQTGQWKLDARYNKPELIQRIRKIARHKDRIHLQSQDAMQFLKPWMSRGSEDAFVYLDPPYHSKGQRLYDNFYTTDDHESVAVSIGKILYPWVV